ncbi:hypothetical protein ACOSP7_031877 [Xanthoceras sorbifolium]
MRSPAPLPVVEPLAGGAVDAFHVTGEPPLDVVEQLMIWDDVSVSTAALVNIVMAKQSKALGKKPVECQAVVIKSQREQPAVTGADSVCLLLVRGQGSDEVLECDSGELLQ